MENYNFEAAITEEQMKELGKSDLMGVNRRIALATLTRSSDQLLDGFSPVNDEDASTLTTVVKAVSDYLEFLEESKALAESAQARLLATAQNFIDREQIESTC